MPNQQSTIPNRRLFPDAWAGLSDDQVIERADAIVFLRHRYEELPERDGVAARALWDAANALADGVHEGLYHERWGRADDR